jgi:hypothetical protein
MAIACGGSSLQVLEIGINLRFLPFEFITPYIGLYALRFMAMLSLSLRTCFSMAVSGDDDVSVPFIGALPPNSGLL